jgi:hypothetical protein
MDIYEDIFFIIPINLCLVQAGTAGSSERNIHFLISVNPSVVLQLTALRISFVDLLFSVQEEKCIQIYTFALYIDAYSRKISYAMVLNRMNMTRKKGM